MIPCTDFIPAYSELFKYLHQCGGKAEVRTFWEYLADHFLHNLKSLVEEKGIRGCWEYWQHTLNEEAADFNMELDEEKGLFRIRMYQCPSKGRLLACGHIAPYEAYCEHCDTLYRRVLEPLGYDYDIDLSDCDRAACTLTVRRREASGSAQK